jgi:ribonucleoside-diphosphate reductase beta chain
MSDHIEPLLQDTHNRFTIFPIIYTDIREAQIKQKEAIWFVDDVDLTPDLIDWNTKLNYDEKYFVKHILAFFAASDGIVNENLVVRFYNEVKWAEARSFYAMQIMMENEHSEMYSRLIETYISDRAEKDQLFNAIENVPAIKKKADWALKWINSSASFAVRLVAFAVVEGIFFSGAFCSIYWLNEKKLMPGLAESNSYIARDEGMHCMFAVLLYTKYIERKPEKKIIEDIVKQAVTIEKEFINVSLPCSLIGMNAGMMAKYIEFCADRLLLQLGYDAIYDAKNPFPFMESICLSTNTNFFDTRSTDYKKKVNAGVVQRKQLTFDDDF